MLIFADGPGIGNHFLNLLVMGLGAFLILLVLIQRGRGGGLAGAFGGAGGSSAFGSKAGDQFTRITIYAAAFWVLFIIIPTRMPHPPPNPTAPPPINLPGPMDQ